MTRAWDIFISHASEDKKDVARPLCELLARRGYKVWFDEHALMLGDNLREKIDEGIRNSLFGVVILSHNFFSKKWPKSELDALVSIAEAHGTAILPILHNITHDEVISYSPILASKLAVSTEQGLETVADKVSEVLIKRTSGSDDIEQNSSRRTRVGYAVINDSSKTESDHCLHPDICNLPLLLKNLRNSDETNRQKSLQIIAQIGLGAVLDNLGEIVSRSTDAEIGCILDGLALIHANVDLVRILERICDLLPGELRSRAIEITSRKRLSLGMGNLSKLFSKYRHPIELQRVLGQGACTSTYLGRHTQTNQKLTVRVLREELAKSDEIRSLFIELSRKSHGYVSEHLVVTRDVNLFPEHGIYYATRDFIEGEPLKNVLSSGIEIGRMDVIRIIDQLFRAVRPIHAKGHAHGGIKPSNIFLAGGNDIILGDLALPQLLVSTEFSKVAYDYRYIAPECFASGNTFAFSQSSDYYSIGCVAYELACGRPPFLSNNPFELAGLHQYGNFENLEVGTDLEGGINKLITLLLNRNSTRRHADIDAIQLLTEDLLNRVTESKQAGNSILDIPASRLSNVVDSQTKFKISSTSWGRYGNSEAALSELKENESVTMVGFTPDIPVELKCCQTPPAVPTMSPTAEVLCSLGDGVALVPSRQTFDSSDNTATRNRKGRSSAWVAFSGSEAKVIPIGVGSVVRERFELLEVVGYGGMGVVYKARDRRKVEAQDRNPFVAIKVLNDNFRQHPESLKALQRESRNAQDLAHPNIVNVFDFDKDSGHVYMVMEFMQGLTLSEYIRKHPAGQPLEIVAPIIRGIALALGLAHSKGIVHSDLKPGNVFIDEQSLHSKVFDFGIARAASKRKTTTHQGDETMFDAGELEAYTPAYASIEMIRGGLNPSPEDDIYAFGLIIYELLTGSHPFIDANGKKINAVQAAVEHLTPKCPRGLNKRRWAALIKALELDRKRRYAKADDLVGELLGERRGSKASFYLSIGLTAVAASVALAIFGWKYLEQREYDRLKAELSSSNPALIKDALSQARANGERWSLLKTDEEVGSKLISFYLHQAQERFNLAQQRYNYKDAMAILASAAEIYPKNVDISDLRKAIDDDLHAERKRLLESFRLALESGTLLRSEGNPNVPDVFGLRMLLDDTARESIPELIDSYSHQANDALDNGNFERASSLITQLEAYAPHSSVITQLKDNKISALRDAAVKNSQETKVPRSK